MGKHARGFSLLEAIMVITIWKKFPEPAVIGAAGMGWSSRPSTSRR